MSVVDVFFNPVKKKGRCNMRCSDSLRKSVSMKARVFDLAVMAALALGWALGNTLAVAGEIYTSHGFGGSLGIINTTTGEFTDVGPYELPESTGMTATAFNPGGKLYGMVQGFGPRGGMSRLVRIDTQIGRATPVGFANPVNTVGLDFGPDGTAYVAGFDQPAFAMKGDPNLYSIDIDTGALTLVGNTGIDRIMDFAFDAAGTMWATTANELYTIDTSTGTSQHVTTIVGVDTVTNDPNAEIMGIMFDAQDVLYATAFIEGSPLFTIDTVTGQATVVAESGLFFPHGGDIQVCAASQVLYVNAHATGDNNGSTWPGAYQDLQDALTQAQAGEEIWVAAGTYTPGQPGDRRATFELKSGVALYGGFLGTETCREQRDPKANETILSGDLRGNDATVIATSRLIDSSTRADNSYHVVTGSPADETGILDGFVISGGQANSSGDEDGSGMINVWKEASSGRRGTIPPLAACPTVVNCVFRNNAALRNGGGLYNERGEMTLTNCRFLRNLSNAPGNFGQGGGAIYNTRSNPLIVQCQFMDNLALDDGAGMTNQNASPTLINCVFRGNRCIGGANIGVGGGIYNNNSSHPTLINCIFNENIADPTGTGGGIFNQNGSHPTLTNCTFIGNAAGPSVGYWANGGGGMFNQDGSRPVVTNCIFWGNRDKNGRSRFAQIAGSTSGTNTTSVNHSCIQGGWTNGTGNIDLDPLFMAPHGPDGITGTADDDLRLAWDSPCIDTGDSSAVPPDLADLNHDGDVNEPMPFDIHGHARISLTAVDIGAHEATDLSVVPDTIYTSHGMGQSLGVLDPLTGEFRDIGTYGLPESTGMTATAFDPQGVLYGMVQGFGARGGMSQLVRIDAQTGQTTPVGFANPINAVALDIAPDGTVYVAGFDQPAFAMQGDPNLYTIDTVTGQLTLIGNTGIDRIMDFAFDSAGTMWATTGNELYIINRDTGASDRVVTIIGVDAATNEPTAEIMGIMFDENDVLHATAFIEGSLLFTLDTVTGQATAVARPAISFPHGGAIVGRNDRDN
jgi:hypothetical protein